MVFTCPVIFLLLTLRPTILEHLPSDHTQNPIRLSRKLSKTESRTVSQKTKWPMSKDFTPIIMNKVLLLILDRVSPGNFSLYR